MSKYNIFVGYRRKDTAGEAGRMYDRLCAAFSSRRVFKDVESIEPGVEFRDHIMSVVNSAEVFLALIGERWEENIERLHEPDDWVRIELEIALRNNVVQVIPVLVGDARMPSRDALPPSIQEITGLQAVHVRQDPDFHTDMDRLIRSISKKDESGAVEVVEEAEDSQREALWAEIENSLDKRIYSEFAAAYPDTREAKLAIQAVKALDAWSRIDQKNLKLVQNFAQKIKGRVPAGLSQAVNTQLRVLLRDLERRRDYKKHEKNRDLDILNLPRKSGREDWRRQYEDWKRDLSPVNYPPAEYPAIAQKLRRIRLAYHRLNQFG